VEVEDSFEQVDVNLRRRNDFDADFLTQIVGFNGGDARGVDIDIGKILAYPVRLDRRCVFVDFVGNLFGRGLSELAVVLNTEIFIGTAWSKETIK